MQRETFLLLLWLAISQLTQLKIAISQDTQWQRWSSLIVGYPSNIYNCDELHGKKVLFPNPTKFLHSEISEKTVSKPLKRKDNNKSWHY